MKSQSFTKLSLAILGALAASDASAIAYTSWQSASTTPQYLSTNGSMTTLSVNQYGGAETLLEVQFQLSATGYGTWSITDQSGGPNNVTNVFEHITVTANGGVLGNLVQSLPFINFADFTLAALGNQTAPGWILPTSSIDWSTTTHTTDSSGIVTNTSAGVLSAFTGAGSINLFTSATSSNNAAGGGDLSSTFLTRYNATLEVRYGYDDTPPPPPPGSVPEIDAISGTGALTLMAGALALAGERRRRRS